MRLPLPLLLLGCAAQAGGPPRWERGEIHLCGADELLGPALEASEPWRPYAPTFRVHPLCHVEINWGPCDVLEDGPEPKVACTTTTETNGIIWKAQIELNPDEEFDRFTSKPKSWGLVRNMAHELGHVLGLEHSENPDALMYHKTDYRQRIAVLSHDDIEAVKGLYE